MPRRVKKKTSLLAPAGSLLRRLSSTDARLRRRIVRYGLWGIGLFFLYSVMSGTYGIPRIVKLKMEKEALIEANSKQLIDLVDATRLRDMLKHDATYINQIARSKYYMTRPDETIFRYRGR